MEKKIVDRIINKTRIQNLIEIFVSILSFSEMQSVLLKIFELKVKSKTTSSLLNDYQSNRFVQPSDVDPVIHRNLELSIFSLLPDGFKVIDLSPLTPLGTSSLLTTIHQNNVVSTIRNLEVAADTTNILALECASRRKKQASGNSKNSAAVKLCASQRLTRGQLYKGEGFSAHFTVIALCSAGKDEGNDKFELECLIDHISFYIRIIDQCVDKNEILAINIKLFEYEGFDNINLFRDLKNSVASRNNIYFKVESKSEYGKGYYTRLRFMISIKKTDNQEFDYIDGGFVDWTGKLLNNRKERLLTSGIGTDFLLRTIRTNMSSIIKGN